MKNIKKILAALLLISTLVTVVGCGDAVGGRPLFAPADAKYWGNFAIDSFDELKSAVEIGKENGTSINKSNRYTLNDSFGEGYGVVYYFQSPAAWISYPVTVEEYFGKGGPGLSAELTTYVFYKDKDLCECGGDHSIFENVDEAYTDLAKYPYVSIRLFDFDESVTRAELIDELEMVATYQNGSRYEYEWSYDGRKIMQFSSCFELSSTELHSLMDHLEILN